MLMTSSTKLNQLLKFVWPGLGGFIAIFALSMLGSYTNFLWLMAPFGASCVLVFLLPASPLAQPKNVILGHLLSTSIGLIILHLLGEASWAIALGVGLAIILMNVFRVVHPPAGGDPILVILAGASWNFIVTPVLIGSVMLVTIGYIYHRLHRVAYPMWANK